MSSVKLAVTLTQSQLLAEAIRAEIKKGAGTFLTDSDVVNLSLVADQLDAQIESHFAQVEAS